MDRIERLERIAQLQQEAAEGRAEIGRRHAERENNPAQMHDYLLADAQRPPATTEVFVTTSWIVRLRPSRTGLPSFKPTRSLTSSTSCGPSGRGITPSRSPSCADRFRRCSRCSAANQVLKMRT